MDLRARDRAGTNSTRLHYTSEPSLSIERLRSGHGFRYRAKGRYVADPKTLARIKALGIPPAWTEVRICKESRGHLQAIGHDARGRKQYIYHPAWREIRDRKKYDRLMAFGKVLPRIRRQVRQDLRQRQPTKSLVLAVVTRLLETSCVRIGNEEYAKANGSFGLTTLRDRHARIRGSTLHLEFKGKSGKRHSIQVADARLARLVGRCQEIPGQELFQYFDENGHRRKIKSNDVNQYIQDIAGSDFTAKDFRTWVGTVLMARALRAHRGEVKSLGDARKVVKATVQEVAAQLGNTPTICLKSYVHPAVVDSFLARVEHWAEGKKNGQEAKSRKRQENEERNLLRLLASAPVDLSLEASLRRALKHAAATRNPSPKNK
jgi:DNA topoisomerase-1